MRKSLEKLVNENSIPSYREDEYFLTDKKVLELLKQVREETLKEAANKATAYCNGEGFYQIYGVEKDSIINLSKDSIEI